MPQKVGFWKRIEKSRKLQWVFFCLSMAVIILGYVLSMHCVRNAKLNEILQSEKTSEDIKFVSDVESISDKTKKIEIAGWAFRSDSKIISGSMLLQPVNSGEVIVLKTKSKKRQDINDRFLPYWDTGMCGLIAEINKNKVSQNVCYEIIFSLCFEYGDEDDIHRLRKTVSTKKYLYNGELYDFIPDEYISPEIDETEIREVIEKGRIRGYDSNKQIWIYNYTNRLYVIIGNDLYEDWEGKIDVPYHLWTTQNDKLPENRKEYGYDNKDFIFSSKEIRISSSNYHVAVVDIPREYPITNIRMGIYDSKENKWIWQVDFLPEINY